MPVRKGGRQIASLFDGLVFVPSGLFFLLETV